MGNVAEVPLFSKLFHNWTPMWLNNCGHRHSLFWEASEKPSTVYVLVIHAWINFSFLVLKYFWNCSWLIWLKMYLPEVSSMITPRLLAPRSLSKENLFFSLGLSFAQKMSFVGVILSYSCQALFLINEVERAINKILNSIQHTSAAPSSSPFPPHLSSTPPFLSTYWTFVPFQSQLHLALNSTLAPFPLHSSSEWRPANKDPVSWCSSMSSSSPDCYCTWMIRLQ